MRFRPWHNEKRKGRGHETVAQINGAATKPRVVTPFLKRSENGVQEGRQEREREGELVPGLGAFERGEPSAHGLSAGGVTPGPPRIFSARESLVIREAREGLGEVFRVKGVQIVDLFANANGVDRQAEFIGQRNKDAAFGRAVEFGHHET